MTKSKSVLNKLTVGQVLNLVYSVLMDYPVYCVVENGCIYIVEEGTEN